jgi:hypothetical protein
MNFQGVQNKLYIRTFYFAQHPLNVQNFFILYYTIYLFPLQHFHINVKHNGGQAQDSSAGVVTRLRAGQPRVQSLAVTRYSMLG